MKTILFLLLGLTLFLYSCTGEEEGCSTAGCDAGYHCLTENDKCEINCTDDSCDGDCNKETGICEEKPCSETGCKYGYICDDVTQTCKESTNCKAVGCQVNFTCNQETGVCEAKPCSETGCNAGYICDTETDICTEDTSCRTKGCQDNFLCNQDSGLCEAACITNVCQDYFSCNNETGLCDPACGELGCATDYTCDTTTQLCQPDTTCRTQGCQDYYKCDTASGACNPACGELGCATDYICNTTTQLCAADTTCRTQGCNDGFRCNTTSGVCEHIACTYNSCAANLICNVHNGYCEAATAYPAGGIANRSWTDTDGKVVSFKLWHNMYIKTGYPKAILLDASAGWCPHCREETPAVKAIYNESVTGHYHKTVVLQEICEDNTAGHPANMTFARGWKSQYGLAYHVSIGTQVRTFRGGVLPVYVIIDPKTMKVLKVTDPREFPDMSAATTKSFLYNYINQLYSRN